jgi:hypothetical protein
MSYLRTAPLTPEESSGGTAVASRPNQDSQDYPTDVTQEYEFQRGVVFAALLEKGPGRRLNRLRRDPENGHRFRKLVTAVLEKEPWLNRQWLGTTLVAAAHAENWPPRDRDDYKWLPEAPDGPQDFTEEI